jgi:LysR family transcriptional regulator, salicylic acid-responsive activator of bsdBCD
MDLKRLKYFCTIVEQGQLLRAAQVLHMSQPPLSQRLKELEDELGVTLMERVGRRMRPTEAGLELYERAQAIFRQLDETREAVLAAALERPETLRIGVSPTCRSRLVQSFAAIHEAYPALQISAVCADSSTLEYMLYQRQVDFALLQRPVRDDIYHIEDLAPTPIIAVVGRVPGAADLPQTLSVEDLARFPLMLLRRSTGVGTYEQVLQVFRQHGVSVNVPLHSPDVSVLLDLLENGYPGVALVPATEAYGRPLTQCALHVIDIGLSIFHPCVAWMSASTPSQTARAVVELIKATPMEGALDDVPECAREE